MPLGSAAASSQSPSPQPPASCYYVWRVPGKPLSVQLLLDIMDRLGSEVMDAFWAVPKRGAEIGGLLLGRRIRGDTVIIEDYELVPCEHKRGPSYQLSDHDRAELKQAIARQRVRPDRQVIGYFRSHTREGFHLEQEDDLLIRQYFADPGDVVLLIKPFASRSAVAGFFIWEDGTIHLESSYLKFPFSRCELAKTDRLAPETVQQPHSEQEPVSLAVGPSCLATVSSQPLTWTRIWRRLRAATERRNWLLPAAATAFVLFLLQYGTFWLLSSGNSGAVRHEQPMPPLRVEQVGPHLHLIWNRRAPAVAEARRGILLITDGAYRKQVHLDVTQLRSGGVVYLPLTDDVNFRLDLEGNHATVTESLRVVIPAQTEAVQAPPQSNSPAASTGQTQADAGTQKVPERRQAKQPLRTKRRFIDDGL